MDLSNLPAEIVIEILLFAAYSSTECARTLAVVSSWTNKLAQQALFSTVNPVHAWAFEAFLNALGLIKGPFPKKRPVADLFRLSFKSIPELSPTEVAKDRARLIHNLWLIPLDVQQRHSGREEHIYRRLLLQLCVNIQSLALSGTTFSHFLMNKSDHFHDLAGIGAGASAHGRSPYPYLTQLILLDSTPASVMEGQYSRAEEFVKIFKQITHLTTYGFFHRDGIPVPLHRFTSLTHVALPLILDNSIIEEKMEPTSLDIFKSTGGWDLVQSTQQIQMAVFLFPSDGQLRLGSHLSNLTKYHTPNRLIMDANRFCNKAYALPIDDLHGLRRLWRSAARGGASIWDLAEDTLRRVRSRYNAET